MQFLRSHKKFKRSFKEDILNGEVRINPETFEITYVANGVKVPITQTSSGISQLAGIILALAKEIYTPELVVIEEPEMNIHPNHQLKVAEFLAKLSNKAKVLITTHSDYLITKLVHLYIKKKIPLLKLYFFNEDGIVEEVEIGEFGEFSIKTFDEVISKLSGEALELVESLKEG
jgi:predicted ATPase